MEYVKEVNRKRAFRVEVPSDQVVFNRSPCCSMRFGPRVEKWMYPSSHYVKLHALIDGSFFGGFYHPRWSGAGYLKSLVILSNLYFVLLLIYIYSSEKCKIKVGLETVDVFCPRASWRKYFTFFWKQKYEQLQFALTHNAHNSFLLLTNKVLRFQRRLRFCFPRWSRLARSPCSPTWPRGAIAHLTRPTPPWDWPTSSHGGHEI